MMERWMYGLLVCLQKKKAKDRKEKEKWTQKTTFISYFPLFSFDPCLAKSPILELNQNEHQKTRLGLGVIYAGLF